jgi:UDP:flavonoid glycosyltransferase YjiC (YdhE family)
MRTLFTTQAGSGHWRPLVPLAKAVRAAGHDVAFATTPVACTALSELGFTSFPAGIDEWLPHLQSAFPHTHDPTAPVETIWTEVFVNTRARHALPDLLTIGESWHPDLIVRESTEFAGCVAAERLGIPHAAVQVGAWRPAHHAFIAPALDALRERVGLAPDPTQAMLFPYLLLTLAPPSFFDPANPLPSTARPMRYLPDDAGAVPAATVMPVWGERQAGRQRVAVTLGTVNNRTRGLLAAILAGLRELPVTVVATTGPDVDPADLGPQSVHVHVERYIPLSQLIPTCELVICHGGFGTVLTTLAAGVPLVIIPIAADQPDNARRCADLGVAEVIGADSRRPEAIREAVRTVLGSAQCRQCAQQLREEMRAAPDASKIVGLLEHLAREGQPLLRCN